MVAQPCTGWRHLRRATAAALNVGGGSTTADQAAAGRLPCRCSAALRRRQQGRSPRSPLLGLSAVGAAAALTCSLLCLLFKQVTPDAWLRGTARSPRWAAPLPLSRCSQTRLPPACDRYPRDARCNAERSQLLRASDAPGMLGPGCRHAKRGSPRHGETTFASPDRHLLASHAASLYSSCHNRGEQKVLNMAGLVAIAFFVLQGALVTPDRVEAN